MAVTTISKEQHDNMLRNSGNQIGSFKAVRSNEIIDAFLNNDLTELIKLHQNHPAIPWYKVIKNSIKNINPIQSNLASTLLEAKLDLLWGNATINDNDLIDKEFLLSLETKVQKYGETLLKIVYEDNKPILELVENYEEHDNDVFEINYFYEIEEKEIKLQELHKDNLQFNKLFEKSGGSWQEININSYPDFFNNLQEEIIHEFKVVYKFENQRCLTRIIPQLNTLDMISTNVDWIMYRGKPFWLISESLAMRNANKTLDEQKGEEIIQDSYNMTIRIVDSQTGQPGEGRSQTELVSPDLSTIENYQKAKETIIIECCNIMGLSATSLGSELTRISSTASSDTLKEHEKLSRRTKQRERTQRTEILDTIFKNLNLKIEIDINDEEEEFLLDKFNFWYVAYKEGNISYEQFLKEVKPNWTKLDVMQEQQLLRKGKVGGI